ncbi:tRNA (cytidine(34)-2'-O)-methyltransferase [Agaricicola taiwanensis]|uniref:tRNA (cytidine(34)-2'-O)-methyltransferase n=1 Tax=Agaricicola taiwanensis TaxID=591372 RepID=A0A8J2VUD6_9RHOB|nr:tRNA (cytidine(34)-2'-O)-methyltransferase [Agaricicola taiwanensis]GGE40022.1 tRNA (cytidine(34)-2'-O)-methyltransferase [Agaricicola taiwanensis]
MRLALYQPDIPQNAGTLMRLGACLGVAIDLIEPAGFYTSDRTFRRAGMDYLGLVDLTRHASFAAFDSWRRETGHRLVLLTTRGDLSHTEAAYHPTDILMVGRETAGVPDDVHDICDLRVVVPMRPALRSLNVAVAGALVLGEALRQTGGYPRMEATDERG